MTNILEVLEICNDADVEYETKNIKMIEESYNDMFAPFLRFNLIGSYEDNSEKWISLIKEYSSDYIPYCEKYIEEIERIKEEDKEEEEDDEDDIYEDEF